MFDGLGTGLPFATDNGCIDGGFATAALFCVLVEGVTAAAAAAAYRIGGSCGAGGLGSVLGNPAFRMLAMGCWAKFGFGGGFGAKQTSLSTISDSTRMALQITELTFCHY